MPADKSVQLFEHVQDNSGRHRPRRVLFLYGKPTAHAHGKGPAIAIDTGMKTFHEWLAEREQRQCEGLWLNDDEAVIGLSKLNPLLKDSAVNKSLTKKPAEAAAPTV